jgi:hypothetical protein
MITLVFYKLQKTPISPESLYPEAASISSFNKEFSSPTIGVR